MILRVEGLPAVPRASTKGRPGRFCQLLVSAVSRSMERLEGQNRFMPSQIKWLLTAAAAVAVTVALAAALWLGGGPTQRSGWEAAGWAAGIISALALIATAAAWAARRPQDSSPTGDDIDQSGARAQGSIIGKRGPAPVGGDRIIQRRARAGGDIIGKQHDLPDQPR